MAAKILHLRRVVSLLTRNQPRTSIYKEATGKFLPPSNAFFSRNDFYKKWIQTQSEETPHSNEDIGKKECDHLKPICESTSTPTTSSLDGSEDTTVKDNVVSKLKMSSRHDFVMIFTCNVCETRSAKTACRESYEKGVVVARCPGCNNLHLIADRLGWFGEPGSIEDFLAAKGEDVVKGSMDTLNLTLEDLAGKNISKD